MVRPRHHASLEHDLVALLAAAPRSASRAELESRLPYPVSQPTLARALLRLRERGELVVEGEARARRYRYAGGRMRVAELRSRRLHEAVARRLVREPTLIDVAERRLAALARANPRGHAYHLRWKALISDRTPEGQARLLRVMTEDSEVAATLRRESPFTVLIPKRQREQIFREFAARRSR